MAKSNSTPLKRRQFTDEIRRDAVQMMLDGLSASAVAERLGLADPTILYIWKKKFVTRAGPVAGTLDDRVRHLEAKLLRVERERDILPLIASILFSLFEAVFLCLGVRHIRFGA